MFRRIGWTPCVLDVWIILKVGIRAAKRPDKAWSPSVKIGTIFWKLMQSENVSSSRPGEVALYRLTMEETSLSQQLIRSSTLHTKTWLLETMPGFEVLYSSVLHWIVNTLAGWTPPKRTLFGHLGGNPHPTLRNFTNHINLQNVTQQIFSAKGVPPPVPPAL